MTKRGTLYFVLILLILAGSLVTADRLPNVSKTTNMQVPATTNLQLVGMMDSQTQVQINTRNYNGTDAESQGFLSPGSAESNLIYKNDMMTNGGYLALAKDQTFDEGNQNKKGYNVDSAIVSTYATDPDKGSRMSTSEQLTLTTTGNWTPLNQSIHNPLVSQIVGKYIGAFESSYDAKSDVSLTTGQLATIAQGRSTGYDDTVPAAVKYQLGIHPDTSTGLPYAQGSAATNFVITNREGYQNTSNESSTKTFADSTKVNGLIFKFGKDFSVESGLEVGGS
ncbi:hypothetical protein [Methanospirillum lacunae]|uniref:Uncharacterized protein n=1 Tax=Methanospirillum lacunae TaxID=668570 RepID=A0A2V2MX85_9EURY|nr:hypothetical protein [Methanospirillum lacunae]PWR72009.1 hypothetical protein DK846_08425 [Methanospirillum lacunae]